jgi:hypothetical protein
VVEEATEATTEEPSAEDVLGVETIVFEEVPAEVLKS